MDLKMLGAVGRVALLGWLVPFSPVAGAGAVKDTPFLQDAAVRILHSPALTNARYLRLEIDRDGVVQALTDRGVARLFGDTLALDRSFRPLAGLRPRDIALGRGSLYYLYEDRFLSNGESGRPLGHLPSPGYSSLAVAEDGAVLVAGPDGISLWQDGRWSSVPRTQPGPVPTRWVAQGREFFGLAPGFILRVAGGKASELCHADDSPFTALALDGESLWVGTERGFHAVSLKTGLDNTPRFDRVPVLQVTSLWPVPEGLWVGTTRGVFFQPRDGGKAGAAPRSAGSRRDRVPELISGPGGIRYYASRRWLLDDAVVDLKRDQDGHLWVLTRTGLNKIEFRPTTLAAKAAWYDRKIRLRHMRFGLTGERRLTVPGEITSSEIVDTDNDGGWSSYYLASQVFRYAATGQPEARANAWEVFAALERLREIAGTNGFFARTFERKGFKYSDPDRWRDPGDGDWEWKGHTSSDEFTSHTLAHALLWEFVAANEPERQRIADNYTRILDHMIRHNWYLLDVDGQPTLWGRWNPEYLNHYPHSIGDRRLNSAEIIAGLQLAHRMTGRAFYREKAEELFTRHGYLTNIVSSMGEIAWTPDYIHLGNNMGDEWNHSDDELGFVIYWVLHRFAFTPALRAQYAAAIRTHWDLERSEQSPIWNFVYSACGGGAACDVPGAVWTLRGWPLDTITWRVENSHRQDVTRLPRNFYGRELAELLPPGERPITRLNTSPFLINGGDGGATELPGDEFLFGYWLGRHLKLIE